MKKERSKEELYNRVLIDRGYDADLVAGKLARLAPRSPDADFFQIKAAILFLSRSVEELDDLVLEANEDPWKVMNWAQVAADRS